ncbi:hypothetical protein BKP42_24020 [Rhodococcus erythropolis]|nr:hypothetical protein BKP42_24020 [Rhodococcus erythropolis]
MNNDREGVLGVADRQQADTDRHVDGDVDRRGSDCSNSTLELIRIRDRFDGQPDEGLRERQNRLLRSGRPVRIHGSKNFVPGQYVLERSFHCGHVEMTSQVQRKSDVVGSRVGVEAVQEPHALLRQRQRNFRGTRLRDERLLPSDARSRFDKRGKRFDGGRIEECPHRHGGIKRTPQTGRDLSGHQGVASEREEVIVETDTLDSQNIRNDLRNNLLDFG